ncbi:MAG: RluA family pseudouridine synthase [Bacteroidetes bacterium]|nr:MAG: RluA family pseudouridine synthase [Bacteroidota bacterium]
MSQRIPQIIYEDNHLLVVNKPFGMPAQADISGDESVFDWGREYLKNTYNKPGNAYLALPHRLDRPTGGIMLLGKTSKAAARLSKQFQQRQIQKVYYAITESVPAVETGTLVHYLKKLPGKNIMRAYHKAVHGSKPAELHYRLVATSGNKALLEVHPHTGRRHQIRVQLASMGCVIQGDVKYGKTSFNFDKSIALFAKKIGLIHPTQKVAVTYEAPWPQNEIWQIFQSHF